MRPGLKSALAILAGMAVWAVSWNLGTRWAQGAFPAQLAEGEPITSMAALGGLIAASVLLSLLAGWLTARLRGGPQAMRAVWILALIQLAIGIVAEVSYWALMPLWYHLVFLALVVPATVAGGMLRGGRETAGA